MGTSRRGETGRGRMRHTGGQTGREEIHILIYIFINVFEKEM